MRFKRGLWCVLAVLLVLCLVYGGVGLADAGNFAGDSDWGGGSDWDSSSSWNDDSDWGSSAAGGFIGCVGGGVDWIWIVIIVVLLVISSLWKKRKKPSGSAGGASVAMPKLSILPISTLKQKDPLFSEEDILEKVANDYMQMQNAWQNKDWAPMRMLMTDSLYNQFARQLEPFIKQRQTNRVERIAVLQTRLTGYAQDQQHDVITVLIKTRIVDYTIDDATQKVLRGDPNKELFMTYEWTLIRSKDVLTQEKDAVTEISCKNCGAPMSIKHTAKCAYCGTVMTVSDYDWVISAIRGISQQSS
ncbi:MAG: TIM44-like domain-containing protein [Christensenellales bacterium]|jgi:ribosomal protein L37E